MLMLGILCTVNYVMPLFVAAMMKGLDIFLSVAIAPV